MGATCLNRNKQFENNQCETLIIKLLSSINLNKLNYSQFIDIYQKYKNGINNCFLNQSILDKTSILENKLKFDPIHYELLISELINDKFFKFKYYDYIKIMDKIQITLTNKEEERVKNKQINYKRKKEDWLNIASMNTEYEMIDTYYKLLDNKNKTKYCNDGRDSSKRSINQKSSLLFNERSNITKEEGLIFDLQRSIFPKAIEFANHEYELSVIIFSFINKENLYPLEISRLIKKIIQSSSTFNPTCETERSQSPPKKYIKQISEFELIDIIPEVDESKRNSKASFKRPSQLADDVFKVNLNLCLNLIDEEGECDDIQNQKSLKSLKNKSLREMESISKQNNDYDSPDKISLEDLMNRIETIQDNDEEVKVTKQKSIVKKSIIIKSPKKKISNIGNLSIDSILHESNMNSFLNSPKKIANISKNISPRKLMSNQQISKKDLINFLKIYLKFNLIDITKSIYKFINYLRKTDYYCISLFDILLNEEFYSSMQNNTNILCSKNLFLKFFNTIREEVDTVFDSNKDQSSIENIINEENLLKFVEEHIWLFCFDSLREKYFEFSLDNFERS